MPIAVLLMAGTSWAADPAPNYARSGWYLGVGGGVAFDFLEDAVADKTGGVVDLLAGGSFNARGGYRVTSWFALEIMYEGNYAMAVETLGVEIAEFSAHSFVVNLKFIAPIWRIHPYLAFGPGVQYGNFNGEGMLPGPLPPLDLDTLDTTRWDFTLRTAIGVDAYISENWLLNVELAPSIRFADYGNIPSKTTDNVTLTVSAGVQYRF